MDKIDLAVKAWIEFPDESELQTQSCYQMLTKLWMTIKIFFQTTELKLVEDLNDLEILPFKIYLVKFHESHDFDHKWVSKLLLSLYLYLRQKRWKKTSYRKSNYSLKTLDKKVVSISQCLKLIQNICFLTMKVMLLQFRPTLPWLVPDKHQQRIIWNLIIKHFHYEKVASDSIVKALLSHQNK